MDPERLTPAFALLAVVARMFHVRLLASSDRTHRRKFQQIPFNSRKYIAISMVITLIGYRGSGKTTVARPLAERLGWQWVDADTVIEQRAAQTIKEIFASAGEPAFREWERQVMDDLLGREDLVIAAGGGAILNPETRQLVRQAGPVVWLQASLETLHARIQEDATTAQRRPNLTNQGGLQEIAQVLAIREPLYRECASLIVDTDTTSIPDIVEHIVNHVSQFS